MAKILVLDDSLDILEGVKYILDMEGHESITVSNKRDLEAQLIISHPDLIIMDVLLGGHDGRQICKELKSDEKTKHIPIILMSASPGVLKEYKLCEANDTIGKPFHLKDFTHKVDKVLKLLPIIISYLSLK
jgi:DNA-binding response OmpR family regulator